MPILRDERMMRTVEDLSPKRRQLNLAQLKLATVVRTSEDQCGPVWTSEDQCGPVWMSVDQCGPVQCGEEALLFDSVK